MSASTSASPAPTPAIAPTESIKLALFLSEEALAPVIEARDLLAAELDLGTVPPLDLLVELALLRVDPQELATSLQASLLNYRARSTAELDLGEPPLDAELPLGPGAEAPTG
jgi:hypothetical protein